MQTRSERYNKGQIIVAAAFLLTVLVGFMGLAVDVGYMVDYRRRMTAAADAAAVAGAWELRRVGTNARYNAAAQKAAADNGFTSGTNGITVTVNTPPTSGDYIGKTNYVEAIIKQPRPTFFLRALNIKSTTVTARAVAGAGSDAGCIYVLDPKMDIAFTVNGGATINAPLCNIFVNSTSLTAGGTTGGACVTAHRINFTGNYGAGCFTPQPNTKVPPVPDPFASLQPPSAGSCVNSALSKISDGALHILNGGTYCLGISITGTGTQVIFNPGLYILQGGLSISGGATISGTGVTFNIPSGGVSITGGGLVQLSAPTSGPWEGILFFQNRFNISPAKFAGGGDLLLEGVLYFPNAPMTYSGGRDTNPKYTVLVSRTLKFTGSSSLNGDFTGLAKKGDDLKKLTLVE